MARSLSFTQIKSFYDVLAEYKNEDNYTLANASFAAESTNLPSASAKSALKTLQSLGCLKVYTAERAVKGEAAVTSEYVPRGGASRLTIIKLTDTPPTKEMYGLYLVDKVEAEQS